MVRGEAPQPPVAQLIGFSLTTVGRGRARIEFDAGPQHANPRGTLHGGILCDIADAAMGLAYSTTLGESESFTTLELKINFLKPVWRARLKAVGEWSNRGARWDGSSGDRTDEKGSLVARATSTGMTLRGNKLREGKQSDSLNL